MLSKRNLMTLVCAIAISSGAGMLLGAHNPAHAADKSSSNADYARDAIDHLKKAHEDVNHLVDSTADQKSDGYADAKEAKKAIDRASKALDRYVAELK